MIKLGVNPESIAEFIARAHQFQSQDALAPPSSTSEAESTNPSMQELRIVLEDLEPDQQVDMVALMWVGRGDYSLEEWESARQDAADQWTPRTADYLIGTPLVADYWSEALSLLESDET